MKFLVPASCEYHGELKIEADSAEEAIKKANSLTSGEILEQLKANGPSCDVYIEEDSANVESVEDDVD